MHIIRGGDDLSVPGAPNINDLPKHLAETAPAILVLRRVISAAEKRLQGGSQKYIQRPPSRAGGRLHKGHIDLVHVRTFFAIDFDAHEMFVQISGDILILERFAFHYMAPMAGGIADA